MTAVSCTLQWFYNSLESNFFKVSRATESGRVHTAPMILASYVLYNDSTINYNWMSMRRHVFWECSLLWHLTGPTLNQQQNIVFFPTIIFKWFPASRGPQSNWTWQGPQCTNQKISSQSTVSRKLSRIEFPLGHIQQCFSLGFEWFCHGKLLPLLSQDWT